MQRVDPFTPLHKGLRRALFDTAQAVARADFALGEDAREAVLATRRALTLLGEHSAHEDSVLMPELLRLAPELHATLHADHVRAAGTERELASLLSRIEGAEGAERISLGRRLGERIVGLVVEQLRHLAREESDAARVLWAHRSDAELAALEGRILGTLAPGRLADWMALALPAVNRGERRELLVRLGAAVGQDAFEAATARARAALGERAWREAQPETAV